MKIEGQIIKAVINKYYGSVSDLLYQIKITITK